MKKGLFFEHTNNMHRIYNKMISFNMSKSALTQMIHDISYALTIIIGVHILMYITNDECKILNETILKLILFALLSMVLFHIVIKKLIVNS